MSFKSKVKKKLENAVSFMLHGLSRPKNTAAKLHNIMEVLSFTSDIGQNSDGFTSEMKQNIDGYASDFLQKLILSL